MAVDGPTAKLFSVKPTFPHSRRKEALSPEARFWRSFKPHQISGLVYPVTFVDYSPSPPHDFAISASAAVSIYNPSQLSVKSTIRSFTDIAYSPSFRSDGHLLAAGCESGVVQVFDPRTHTFTRQLRAHAGPARVVRFPRVDKLHLFSAADDAFLNYWDVASPEAPLLSIRAHKDYIRAGSPSPVIPEIFATGSYDHSISLWDVRSSSASPIMNLKHNKPVESIVFLPSGGLLASAGGNSVKVWDIISGGKFIHTMESHNKTVTALCLGKIPGTNEQPRLLTVSLDGFMKVFDFSAFKITHSMRFPAPLVSVSYSPCCDSRVIGTSNGILYIGRRKRPNSSQIDHGTKFSDPKRAPRPISHRYFYRRQHVNPSQGDSVVGNPKRKKVAKHDKLLNKFHHKDALVQTLRCNNPENVMAVMEELVARKKLLKSVSNLDSEEIGFLFEFLHKYCTRPTYATFLMNLAKKVVQMRAPDIRESAELRKQGTL